MDAQVVAGAGRARVQVARQAHLVMFVIAMRITVMGVRDLAELWLSDGGDPARALAPALHDLHAVRHDLLTLETAAWAWHRVGRDDEAWPLILRARDTGSHRPRLLERFFVSSAALADRNRAGAALARH